ncbi:hypothetical protein [Streptomyces sp. 1222.5]|uniref:hypothetical protein n=1 Tax=Streptomyces sp. 1222.5 TaxID=1881026 RepID=UPI003EBC2AFD
MNRVTRRKIIGASIALTAIGMLPFTLPTASAEPNPVDALGQIFLVARQHGNTTGQAVADYCKEAGYGDGFGQCKLLNFAEMERDAQKNYSRRVSDYFYACEAGRESISYTEGNRVSFDHSGSFTNSLTITITEKGSPLGVGADVKESIGWEWGYKFTYSKAESNSTTESRSIDAKPGYVYWMDYQIDHGIARGLALVDMPWEPKAAAMGIERGQYIIPESVTGDLWPSRDKKVRALQANRGYELDSRPMTAAEKEECGVAGEDSDIEPPGGGDW